MLIFTVILLSVLLITSIVLNVLLYKASERQMTINDDLVKINKDLFETNQLYANWISEWRQHVFKTYAKMKMLDDKEMFSKDDDVGIVFQDMMELIKSLNDRTEETTEEGE